MGIQRKRTLGVYAHIPFCASKCPYCDFNSTSVPVTAGVEKRYTDALLRELCAVLEGIEDPGQRILRSVYIGGGTPSVFSGGSIGRVVEGIKRALPGPGDNASGVEVTVEVNPESATFEKFKGLKDAGANRLSIGLQSLSDTFLKALGRAHSARGGVEAFRAAREAGFENIGVDLIFGLPGQTPEEFAASLSGVMELAPEHISVYGLTIEDRTPFHARYSGHGRTALPSEDETARMYSESIEALESNGWRQYEISNFARPGRESAHNSGYWLGRDYIGLGSGAHSYLGVPRWGQRWWNERGTETYMDRVESSGTAVKGREALERGSAMTESVMCGLRMTCRGIEVQEFTERFGLAPEVALRGLGELESDGLVLRRKGPGGDRVGPRIVLSAKGLLLSDSVVLRALS